MTENLINLLKDAINDKKKAVKEYNNHLDKNLSNKIEVLENLRKDINEMMLRIVVNSSDGDKVRVNLPMGIVKVIVEGSGEFTVNGNKALENIDFNQIWQMVQNGMIGELVSIESSDGDFVTIFVE